MNHFKRLLILLALITMSTLIKADEHPKANFGIYGIQHYATLAEYQKHYLGQVVKYIPQQPDGSCIDLRYFQEAGGKFDTEYIITKISGQDTKMTFLLTEKENGKNKIKFVINNKDKVEGFFYCSCKSSYSMMNPEKFCRNSCYCITDTYSVPLILSEKLEADKLKYIGKLYPSNPDSPVKMEITDIVMREDQNSSYPKAYYMLTDKADGKIIYYDIAHIDDLNDLGQVFTNPKYKCSYTVVNVFAKKEYAYDKETTKYYTVKNSIDGSTKDIKSNEAKVLAFKGDDSGEFIAILEKVEKPSNNAIRHGKQTTATDKDISKFSYIDNFIDILLFVYKNDINFVLKNVSNHTLKLIWNEAVFIDVDGSTSKVMHTGIKYSEREADQLASIIIKGAILKDIATPIDKVYYSTYSKEWVSQSIYSQAKIKQEGQKIKLMLPIEIKDVINEYVFEFGLTYVYDHPEYLSDEF